MPRIITALFEDRGVADRALQALVTAGIARDRIAILGEPHQRASEMAPLRSVPARDSALGDLSLPSEDLALYAQALEHDHVLVTARIDSDRFEDAISTLDMFNPVDLDQRAQEWRQGQAGALGSQGVDVGGPLGAGLTAGASAVGTNTGALPGSGQLTDGTHDVGSADLRTDETGLDDLGRSTDVTTGDRRAEERAGAPGVLELGTGGREVAPKARSGPDQSTRAQPDAGANLFRRETNRSGRVRSYVR